MRSPWGKAAHTRRPVPTAAPCHPHPAISPEPRTLASTQSAPKNVCPLPLASWAACSPPGHFLPPGATERVTDPHGSQMDIGRAASHLPSTCSSAADSTLPWAPQQGPTGERCPAPPGSKDLGASSRIQSQKGHCLLVFLQASWLFPIV